MTVLGAVEALSSIGIVCVLANVVDCRLALGDPVWMARGLELGMQVGVKVG